MNTPIKSTLLKTLAFCGGLMASVSAQASDELGTTKILQAAEQNTLTQQIANASCYIGTFNEVDQHLAVMDRAQKQFEQNHYNLQRVQSDVGSLPETNTSIVNALHETLQNWELVRFFANLSADMPQNPGLDIDLMARYNEGLYQSTQKLSQNILEVYGNKSPSLNTLNHLAKLGYLIQKASKEFCYVSYGLMIEENKTKLLQTMNNLDQSLADLLSGNLEKDILAAPNEQIKTKLMRIQSQWLVVRRIMYNTASGNMARSNDFKIVSNITDPLTNESMEIARLFVAAYQKHQESLEKSKN